MAKNKSLQKLIDDLDYLEHNFDLFEDYANNIIAALMVEIGKTTAYDTGLVRDIISNVIMDLGRPDLVDELQCQIFEYWKSREHREQDDVDYSFDVNKESNKTDYKIKINDYGFYNQQQGKVSEIHPRHDDNVIPYNVNYHLDKLETGGNARIDMACEDLKEIIIRTIEEGV